MMPSQQVQLPGQTEAQSPIGQVLGALVQVGSRIGEQTETTPAHTEPELAPKFSPVLAAGEPVSIGQIQPKPASTPAAGSTEPPSEPTPPSPDLRPLDAVSGTAVRPWVEGGFSVPSGIVFASKPLRATPRLKVKKIKLKGGARRAVSASSRSSSPESTSRGSSREKDEIAEIIDEIIGVRPLRYLDVVITSEHQAVEDLLKAYQSGYSEMGIHALERLRELIRANEALRQETIIRSREAEAAAARGAAETRIQGLMRLNPDVSDFLRKLRGVEGEILNEYVRGILIAIDNDFHRKNGSRGFGDGLLFENWSVRGTCPLEKLPRGWEYRELDYGAGRGYGDPFRLVYSRNVHTGAYGKVYITKDHYATFLKINF